MPNQGRALTRARDHSLGVSEGEYLPAYVEPVRIVNVNIDDWSVDAVSEYANKRFFDIQVMSPYFHYANGEGIYVMPEVGAYAWVCWQSTGRMASPFIMGFKAPFDESHVNYRCNRQNLNPGDIMLRTRDENFIILRRGGVIQIGSTPTCQTLYVPIKNIIRQFCENYELNTFGGDLLWSIERDDQTIDGSAPAKLRLRAKEKANDPGHIAELSIGSHGDGNPVTLELTIRDSGLDSAKDLIRLQLTKEGNVSWEIEGSWAMNVKEDVTLSVEGSVDIDVADTFTASAQKDVLIKSGQESATLDGMKKVTIKSATEAVVDAPMISLGTKGLEPVVKGTKLAKLLSDLITQVSLIQQTSPPAPTTAPSIGALAATVPDILSATVFTA